MLRRDISTRLAIAVALLLTAFALSPPNASGVFEQDPGFPDCLDPELDPFCPQGPGDGSGDGGGGGSGGCQSCSFIPSGPDGQPAEYYCETVAFGETGYVSCTAYANGCDLSNICKVA